jgi:predicted transcriptional regulator
MVAAAAFFALFSFAQAGRPVSQVSVTDINGSPAAIPYLGIKTLVVFYIDPDVRDISDTLSKAIKARDFPPDNFAAIGMVNCRDSWIPRSLIKTFSNLKHRSLPRSMLLFDDNHALKSAWALGDCNDRVAVFVIGKDMKIKYSRTISSKNESGSIIDTVISVIAKEIKSGENAWR